MKWFNAIDATNLYSDWHEACGKCSDCGTQVNTSKWKHSKLETNIRMIGLDMNENNVILIRNVTKILKLNNKIDFTGINLTTIFAGGSDHIGEVVVPLCVLGDESCSLTEINNANTANRSIAYIPLLTVDQIVRDLDRSDSFQANGIQHSNMVDLLLIDTEGHDPLVIQGAKDLLQEGRIRCIMFEYHVS